jgi:HPt (histidine-containing phosphotransfer) domain-containing protein
METLTDLNFLQTFTGGNKDKIVKYINLFLQACPEQLDKMNARLAEKDYPGLRAAAHTLKPQVIYMGMKRGEEMVKRIESMAGEQRDVDQLPGLVSEFNKHCADAIDELKKAL